MAERLHETRDMTIARHLRLALDSSPLTEDAYAEDVRKHYQARTPEHLRRVEFHAHVRGGDPYKVMRANAQLVRRMLDGNTVRLAAEVEEALVLALPQPFQRACLADLSARYGLLAVERPADGRAGTIDQMGHLAADFGRCVSALAETIGDGHLTRCDVPGARVAIREIDELVARALTLKAAHQQLLAQYGQAPAAPVDPSSAWHMGPPEEQLLGACPAPEKL